MEMLSEMIPMRRMSPGRTTALVPMRDAMRTLFRPPSFDTELWASDNAWVAPGK